MSRKPSLSLYNPPASEICDSDESFKKGLCKIREKVGQLFDKKDDVVLAINEASPKLGRLLASRLDYQFTSEGVPVGICDDLDNLVHAAVTITERRIQFQSNLGLYIIGDATLPHGLKTINGKDMRALRDAQLKRKAEDISQSFEPSLESSGALLPLNQVDVWAAISTTSRPFFPLNNRVGKAYDPFEDVIIRINDDRKKK